MSTRNLALAGIVTAAIAAPLIGLVYLWQRPLPILKGRLRLRALRAPVQVIRDRWGIPHIYAQNTDDLFFAQGFVHAQDRLWQMELNRRIAAGRLSEMVGALTVNTDQLLRTIGLARAAENDYAHMSDNGQRILTAYTRGVNTFIETNQKRLPIEFTLLRFTPEPWRPQDSLGWAKMMSWGQGINWDAEILRAAIMDRLGPERAAQLLGQDIGDTNPLILNHNTPIPGFDRLVAELHAARRWLNVTAPVGMSNNWVVDGAKSTTGKPLLANDPHLPLQMPSLWYEMHLHAPELQAAGVSLPGTPCIILGHNQEIAWGMTNAFADVQDVYIEKFNPANPGQYEYQGAWQTATILHEEIRVKGESKPRPLDITLTQHGPIINAWFEDALPPSAPAPASPNGSNRKSGGHIESPRLALKWQGTEASRALDAAYALNRAHTWDEFRAALRQWDEPALSFVYGDRAGNIGYYLAGRVPQRRNGKGVTPVPGWTDEYEWTGWIPFDELPHAYNPPQHYMATANNQVVGQEYPHHLTVDTANGFRAKRIVTLLTAQERLSADDYARIQTDLYCDPAQTFLKVVRACAPELIQHPLLRGHGLSMREALTAFDQWDVTLTPDSVPAALYEVTLHFAMERLFQPWLGDLTRTFIGVGFQPLLLPLSAYSERAYLIALRILENQETHWMRDRQGNPLTNVDILAGAFLDAFQYLESNVGFDSSKWQWGKLHRAGFKHALGTVKPLDRLLNRGPFPYGGDSSTVWQAAFTPELPISDGAVLTASWRQILDLSDWDASRGILPAGQSGHPASRHYADMIQMWLKGEYHPLLWSRDQVQANAEATLSLEPH